MLQSQTLLMLPMTTPMTSLYHQVCAPESLGGRWFLQQAELHRSVRRSSAAWSLEQRQRASPSLRCTCAAIASPGGAQHRPILPGLFLGLPILPGLFLGLPILTGIFLELLLSTASNVFGGCFGEHLLSVSRGCAAMPASFGEGREWEQRGLPRVRCPKRSVGGCRTIGAPAGPNHVQAGHSDRRGA
jgi:hypothetical protein